MRRFSQIAVLLLASLMWAVSPASAEEQITWELLEGRWSGWASAEGEDYPTTAEFSRRFAPYSVRVHSGDNRLNRIVKVEGDGNALHLTSYDGVVREKFTLHRSGDTLKLKGEYEYHSGWGEMELTKKQPGEPYVKVTDLGILTDARAEGRWEVRGARNDVRFSGKFVIVFTRRQPEITSYKSSGEANRPWSPAIFVRDGEIKMLDGNRTDTFRLRRKNGKTTLEGSWKRNGVLQGSTRLVLKAD